MTLDAETPVETLSLEKAKSEARTFGIASAVFAAIALISPSRGLAALLCIPLACTGWLFLFHGSTVISMRLQGGARRRFQVVVAVLVPLGLSLFFLHEANESSFSQMVRTFWTPWLLLPLVVFGYISWQSANQLDRDHPFRGFIIASVVLFVFCLFGYLGIYSEYDQQTETSMQYIDKEAAREARETGRYFVQYLLYVTTCYAALLAKRTFRI